MTSLTGYKRNLNIEPVNTEVRDCERYVRGKYYYLQWPSWKDHHLQNHFAGIPSTFSMGYKDQSQFQQHNRGARTAAHKQLQENWIKNRNRLRTIPDGNQSLKMLSWPIYKVLDLQQRVHVPELGEFARHHLTVFDNSQAGTGKTYSSFGFVEQIQRNEPYVFSKTNIDFTAYPVPPPPIDMFVFSIKSVLPEFVILANRSDFQQSVRLVGWANLELAILGKCYQMDPVTKTQKVVKNPYLTVIKNTDSKCRMFYWNYPCNKPMVFIFDEGHKMRNKQSEAFRMFSALLSSVQHLQPQEIPFRILILTATLLEKPEAHIPTVMYQARLIPSPSKGLADAVLRDERIRAPLANQFNIGPSGYFSAQMDVLVLHHLMFKGSFPCARAMKLDVTIHCNSLQSTTAGENKAISNNLKNEVCAIACVMSVEERQKIEEASEQLWNHIIEEGCGNKLSCFPLILQGVVRHQIELCKINTYVALSLIALKCNLSVVTMFNFQDCLDLFIAQMSVKIPQSQISVIRGGQKMSERTANYVSFQQDERRVCALIIKAGGTGISLHDIREQYPRLALMNLPVSASEFTQAKGRAFRNKARSDCLQLIVICKDTIEEKIYHRLKSKASCLDILNDGYVSVSTSQLFDNTTTNEKLVDIVQTFSVAHKPRFQQFLNETAYLRE